MEKYLLLKMLILKTSHGEIIMQLENISYEELLNVLLDYIRGSYDYDTCDIFDDVLQFTLENGKHINIYINVENEED